MTFGWWSFHVHVLKISRSWTFIVIIDQWSSRKKWRKWNLSTRKSPRQLSIQSVGHWWIKAGLSCLKEKFKNIEFKCSTFRTIWTFTRTRISIIFTFVVSFEIFDFQLWTFEDDYELFSISGLLSRVYDSYSTMRNEIDEITKDGFINYESLWVILIFRNRFKSIFETCWCMHLSLIAAKEASDDDSNADKSFKALLKEKYRHALANNTDISLFNQTIQK